MEALVGIGGRRFNMSVCIDVVLLKFSRFVGGGEDYLLFREGKVFV